MSKPTFVFVPGAWHSPEIYASSMSILEAASYPTVGLPLPSVGASPAHTSFDGDVQAIRQRLTQLIEVDHREVILVSHSYAGMPAGEAPVGLSKREREANGLPGGLIRFVSIMGYIVPEGFTSAPPGAQMPEWMTLDPESGTFTVAPQRAKEVFYNDLPPDEADKWIAKLRPQSAAVFVSKTTAAAWRHVPSTYIIGTQDRTSFTRELVDSMISEANKLVPGVVDTVETCVGGGHCLMISQPEWLADVLRRAAEKIV